MATQTLEPDLLESLEESSREVLESMVFMTPESIATTTDSDAATPTFHCEVIGMLGFTGTRSGNMVIGASEGLARKIAAKMLMMETDEFEDFGEAADGFGELVNMITGSFKNAWVAKGNEMNLAVPVVARNSDLHVPHNSGRVGCSVRIMLEGEPLDMTLLFEGHD